MALVAERPTHGWAVAAQLARVGEAEFVRGSIGSIWSMGRPLVYQALERLHQAGLTRPAGFKRGTRGPHRVMFEATPKGRKAVREWLSLPVENVREIRSLFLLKVVLLQRAGLSVESLLVSQRAILVPYIALLESHQKEVDPLEAPSEATTLRFRIETTKSVVEFINGMLEELRRHPVGSAASRKRG